MNVDILTKAVPKILTQFIQEYGGTILHSDNTMTKIVNGVPVRKQCVAKKDLSHDWIENVKIEDIDLRYFNLDYSKK